MGVLLFIIALTLTSILTALSFVFTPIYYIVTFKWRKGIKCLDNWFFKMALSLDQFGNVSCSKFLQLTMAKGGEDFGGEDDTVSYVLGRLMYKNRLTWFGFFIVWILDIIEKDHVDIAIDKKIESDKEAKKRLEENNYRR